MKKLKKLLALVLTLAICATFALPALALEDSGKTPNDPTNDQKTISIAADKAAGHTYKVYQIFKGTVDSTQDILSDVKVGSALTSFTYPKDGTAIAQGESVPSETLKLIEALSGEQFAKDLFAGEYGTLDTVYATLNEANNWTYEVDPGYYLIVDVSGPDGEEKSPLMLEVISDATIDPKIEQTTLDKTVEDAENTYKEYATKNIGQEFKFKLEAHVNPAAVPQKDKGTYELKFTDTMSKGLDFIGGSVEVKIGDISVEPGEGSGEYVLEGPTANDDGTKTFTLEFDLVAALGDAPRPTDDKIDVVVTYKAKLNSDAIVYPATDENGKPNWNKASLKYGADGETTEETAYVYTFEIDGVKIDGAEGADGSHKRLQGAEFNLYEADDAGKNVGDPLTFVYDETLKGYRLASASDDGASSTITSNENGLFNIIGLKAGNYNLVETKAPDGYNMLDDPTIPVNITITNKKDDKGNEIDELDTVTLPQTPVEQRKSDITDGTVLEVINNQGSTLPSTGGIGTTIFYIVGAVLVVGAGVLLFTKRRARG